MQNLWRVVVMSSALSGLGGCIDFADIGDSQRYKEDFHYTYPLTGHGTVTLENANGAVEISGWNQDQVEITGTKYAATKALLDAIKIDAYASNGAVRIRTQRPSEMHGNWGAHYVLHVPRKALLDSVVTTNGSIRVEDMENNARLKTTNGAVRVDKLHGDLDARTSNGAVEATDIDGDAQLQTTNGPIKAQVAGGRFEARTTNGPITASLLDPSAGAPIRLHSTNGHIDISLKGSKIPDLRAETSNSPIVVKLPEHVSARVRAHTSQGTISSDFDVNGGSRSKTSLEGDIGQGGPLLDLSSTNGPIKILRN